MRITVLGAGVIGTTSAWYLQKSGHQVTVIDRQPAPGNETSFANGGQISVSHAEPWANPHVLPRLIRWLGRQDAPLRWHWRADAAQFAWGLRFLRECLPGRTRDNIGAIVRLALYSRATLQQLRREVELHYDHLERGILHIYTQPSEFQTAVEAARVMREFGLDRHPVPVDRCLEIEPALAGARDLLVGGDYTPSDESGDAHRFTRQLAGHAQQIGVEFLFNTTVDRIDCTGRRVTGLHIRDNQGERPLGADALVVALGSYSPLLLAPLGVHLPVYPAKGYSATLTLPDSSPYAPQVSLTDDERKIVFSRLGNRLRIAGTAEFNGYNLELDPTRCAPLMARTRELFPELTYLGEPEFWCGLRPATPSNVPIIGRPAAFDNLWLNTGHGTLGWTLSCGSAATLTDLINGQTPTPDFPFFRR